MEKVQAGNANNSSDFTEKPIKHNMLVVDGAYLFSEQMAKHGRKLSLTEQSWEKIMELIGKKTGLAQFSEKHYCTSEESQKSSLKRKPMYDMLQEQGVSVDIKDFKCKEFRCRDKACNKPF